jgi:hypothetical protein
LQHKQRQWSHSWRNVKRILEEKNSGRQPVSHETGCAHSAQYTLPTHVDKKVAAQQQIDQRRHDGPTSEDQRDSTAKPDDHHWGMDHRVLNGVYVPGRLSVTFPTLAHEESSRVWQKQDQVTQQEEAINHAKEALRGEAQLWIETVRR